jgi:hypothetical protein
MNCKYFLLIIFSLFTFGCKSKINQRKNGLREGKWITVDSLDYPYKVIGKYKKGNPKGTWKYIYNNKIDRIEKYKKNSICYTEFYSSNGKILRKGYTKSRFEENVLHWF